MSKFQNITENCGKFQVRLARNNADSYSTFDSLSKALRFRNDTIRAYDLYPPGTFINLKSLSGTLPLVTRSSKVSGYLYYLQVHHHVLTMDGPKYSPKQFSMPREQEAYIFRDTSFKQFNLVAEEYNTRKRAEIEHAWLTEIETEVPQKWAGFSLEAWRIALSKKG